MWCAGRRNIYQSIFLDDTLKQHWTAGGIDPVSAGLLAGSACLAFRACASALCCSSLPVTRSQHTRAPCTPCARAEQDPEAAHHAAVCAHLAPLCHLGALGEQSCMPLCCRAAVWQGILRHSAVAAASGAASSAARMLLLWLAVHLPRCQAPTALRPAAPACSQVPLLQGRQHTWYCGAYTLFNTHEIATMSGELLYGLAHCWLAGWSSSSTNQQQRTRAHGRPLMHVLFGLLYCCRPGGGGAAGCTVPLWPRQAGGAAGDCEQQWRQRVAVVLQPCVLLPTCSSPTDTEAPSTPAV